jgi:hypothetical protein
MVPLSCLTRPARCKAPIARVTPGRRTPSMALKADHAYFDAGAVSRVKIIETTPASMK